jgi:drug/metabolite transporter (DMT)-like permease
MARTRRTGVWLSLAAAACFGIFGPAAKAALRDVAPLRAAGLVYLAAGAVAGSVWLFRRAAGRPSLGHSVRRELPRVLAMTLVGGVLGPALFFAGVARVPAHDVAVLQHMEFALTALAAVLVLGERPGARGVAGLGLVGAGVTLLAMLESSGGGGTGTSLTGLLLLVGACAAWAADNTLARGASDLDPLAVVTVKGLGAGTVLAAASSGAWDLEPRTWLLVLLGGGVGIGLSLALELLAVRRIGATLNAGLFATGPAFGFLWSLFFLGESAGAPAWTALVLCLVGAVALARDRHSHVHVHPTLRHSHQHHHLDEEHTHTHDAAADPGAEHEHEHVHPEVEHVHPHVHGHDHRHRH